MPEKANILLIDDELDSCQALSLLLSQGGYNVQICPSGEQALELLGKHPFDLIISDLFLPGISGIDIIKQIKDDSPEITLLAPARRCSKFSVVWVKSQGPTQPS